MVALLMLSCTDPNSASKSSSLEAENFQNQYTPNPKSDFTPIKPPVVLEEHIFLEPALGEAVLQAPPPITSIVAGSSGALKKAKTGNDDDDDDDDDCLDSDKDTVCDVDDLCPNFSDLMYEPGNTLCNTGLEPPCCDVGHIVCDGASTTCVPLTIACSEDKCPTPTSYEAGQDPLDVALGDFNNDGFLDITSTDQIGNTMSVFLNLGDGTFAPRVAYPAPASTAAVNVGDVNNDNNLDIIATGGGSANYASVFLNNGDGTFAPRADYSVGYRSPEDVQLSDLNGDNFLDIVVVLSFLGEASVLLNNGDGTFAAETVYNLHKESVDVSLRDMNGDTFIDMVVVDSFGEVSISFNNGAGAFSPRVIYPANFLAYSGVAEDLDGDSDIDVTTVDLFGGTLAVYFNNSDGTLTSRVEYQSNLVAHSHEMADINSDSTLDAVIIGTNGYSILYNRGDGTFTSGFVCPLPPTQEPGSRRRDTLGDLNNDGLIDLVFSDDEGGQLLVVINNSIAH